jgi:hypothetical protein
MVLPTTDDVRKWPQTGQAESRWVRRMQTEAPERTRWDTRLELASAMFDCVELFHHRQRRHSSAAMLTPLDYGQRPHSKAA